MSALAPSMPLIANAAPMPSASAPPGHGECGQGDAFARCLDQARKSDAADADDAAQRAGAKKPQSNKKTERGARDAGTARADAKAETPTKGKGDAETVADAQATAAHTEHDDTSTPDLAALLPGWTPPAAAPAAATPAAPAAVPVAMAATATAATATTQGAEESDPADICSAIGSAKVSPTPARDESAARMRTPLAAAPTAIAANDNLVRTESASSVAVQTAASEQRRAAADLPTAPLSMTLPSAPVIAPPTTLAAPPQKAAEAAQTTAMLPAPIDSPAFAPALATQLRWWANDGVQQAQLLLNPAEMGPVAVKILLAGNEARIDFSADLAATRGAIEAALPVLAAALDESGLKLTGGGVHDGSAQQQPQWREHGVTNRTRQGTTAADGERATSNASGSRTSSGRGIVDLVA